jgi:ferritin-like metal-binding protein YciE
VAGSGSLAEARGHQEVAQLLKASLEEEKTEDRKLNQIALSEVNEAALEAAA